MAIEKHRSDLTKPFGRLNMSTIRDPHLTNAEVGLLLRLLNLPETWRYSDVGYCCVYRGEGRSAVRNQLKSLEHKGYIKLIYNLKDDKGRFAGSKLIVYEQGEPQK